jgi:molecular chaperone DnaK (HSP70)
MSDGSTIPIRGKGPNGVFISSAHYEDATWYFDADARALGAIKPNLNAKFWKGKLGTDTKLIDGQFTPEEVETAYTKYQRKVAEEQLNVTLEGIPMYLSRSHSVSDVGANCQRQSVEKAGFTFGKFASEQLCAAYGHAKRHDLGTTLKSSTFFIADDGGFSFDTGAGTLCRYVMDLKGTRSVANVGGVEMGRLLMELVLTRAAKQLGVKKIDISKFDADTLYLFQQRNEECVINLSTAKSVQINVVNPDTGKPVAVKVTQDDFTKEILANLFKAKQKAIEETLADAKLNPKDIDFLIASGAPMNNPAMQKWLSGFFDRPIEVGVDYSHQVVAGLAAYAFDDLVTENKLVPEGYTGQPIITVDRLPAIVAVMMLNESGELVAVPLFDKDTRVPSKAAIMGRLTRIDQTDLNITLVQAPRKFARFDECIPIGKGELRGLTREQVMTDRLLYEGDAQSGGLLVLTVTDKVTGKSTVVTATTLRHDLDQAA